MFQVTILTVDAFTARAFSGNPAAICDLSNDELFLQFEKFNQKHNGNGYQLIAREMNLSETAFLLPYKKQDNIALLSTEKHFSLRWFTPTVEVPLCGHATLATSHYVFQDLIENNSSVSELVFHNPMSGELRVKKMNDIPDGNMLQMDFPQGEPVNVRELFLSHGSSFRQIISDIFLRCFALSKFDVQVLQKLPRARSDVPVVTNVDEWDFVDHFVVDVEFCRKTRKLLLVISCVDLLFMIGWDSKAIGSRLLEIKNIPQEYVDVFKGVIVTCHASRQNIASEELWINKFSLNNGMRQKYDCVTRYFAPWLGIPEDPVNGASHTVLVVYWSKKLGIDIIRAFQASEREGELWLELAKEPNKSKRMYMRGYAKTVLKGVLFLE